MSNSSLQGNVEKLREAVEYYGLPWDIELSAAADEAEISRIQTAFPLRFPRSLVDFWSEANGARLFDVDFLSVARCVEESRAEWNFAEDIDAYKNFIVFARRGDGTFYALDTSSAIGDGESRVVYATPDTTADEVPSNILADNFREWLDSAFDDIVVKKRNIAPFRNETLERLARSASYLSSRGLRMVELGRLKEARAFFIRAFCFRSVEDGEGRMSDVERILCCSETESERFVAQLFRRLIATVDRIGPAFRYLAVPLFDGDASWLADGAVLPRNVEALTHDLSWLSMILLANKKVNVSLFPRTSMSVYDSRDSDPGTARLVNIGFVQLNDDDDDKRSLLCDVTGGIYLLTPAGAIVREADDLEAWIDNFLKALSKRGPPESYR